MTLRSICSSAAAALASALVLALTAAPLPALADDRASVETGRSAGRAVLMFRDPRGCAIALLRERCIADVDAFLGARGDGDFGNVPNVGSHPATGLRAFVANGDRDAFDFALRWINNRMATEAQWKNDPRDAALYDAGVLDVFLAAAGPDRTRQMLAAAPATDLAAHAAHIPAGTLPVDFTSLRGYDPARPNASAVLPLANDLVRALRSHVAPPALAPVPNDDGPAASAALGVDLATMAELLDAWPWAMQPEAQTFGFALADRLDAIVPAVGRSFVATFRVKVRAGPDFDRISAAGALTSAVAVYDAASPAERKQRIALGSAAAQLAYNAANTRSPDVARSLLLVLTQSALLDAAVPGWQAARTEAAPIGPLDWLPQRALGVRLVDLIEKVNRS
ncbi:MAG TPA: hypothetical protein VGD01_18710 [Candidatus Elarobacter sp.]